MKPALRASLIAVGGRLRDVIVPWWIIGSSAVELLGADAGDVHDVDVITEPRDAAGLYLPFEASPVTLAPDPLFRSAAFACWKGAPLPVELIAGFEVRSDNEWWPVAPLTRQPVQLGDETLYVPDRDELIALLRKIGRPKDLRRATALEGREPG